MKVGSAKGERLPRKSGSTCRSRASSAARERPPARATISRSIASKPSPPPGALALGCMRMRWSIAAPKALWPPSASHWPGVIAEKYGPQTPRMKRGSSATAMQQAEVPRISAMRRAGELEPPSDAAPMVAKAPAWASISPAATGTPGRSPIASAAAAVSPRPSAAPGSTTSAPMRAQLSRASAPSPMLSKKSRDQPRSCAR